MVTYNRRIDFDTWRDILEDFADLVAEGRYAKAPYRVWREMINLTRGECDDESIVLYWEVGPDNDVEIHIYPAGMPGNAWIFAAWDDSFGDFIYENLLRGCENGMDYYAINERGYYTLDRNYTDTEGVTYASALSTKADYMSALDTKADMCEINRIDEKVSKLCDAADLAAPMTPTHIFNIEKEKTAMKFNFDFGPVNPSLVRMSMYGLAVKNKAGTWVSFNPNDNEIVDVDVLNFDGAKFLYRAPVAIKDIAVGDIVIHNSVPMFVVAIPNDGKALTVVDTVNGERKDIMLPRSPFGFNFATKVINFLGNMMTGATAENPFGNLWMLMAMSGENKDMNDLLPLVLMSNANSASMDTNMLMVLALSGNKGNNDMLPLLMMMNANKPAHVCTCGGACGENPAQN